MADALSLNSTHLVSIGGIQSNHTRAVAGVAAKLGLGAKVIQENWVPDVAKTEPTYLTAGNLQLSRLLGADVRVNVEGEFVLDGGSTGVLDAMKDVEAEGGRAYVIPAGASEHPLGGLGFARWAWEVARQEEEMGVFFETVVTCVVSGSTLAGMIAGFKLLEQHGGRKRRVLGIEAAAKPAQTKDKVLRIARVTARRIGVTEEVREEDVEIDERWHAGVYGIADGTTVEAMRLGAETEGMLTDPVYEGKSLAGLVGGVKEAGIKGYVLYAHLGGQMALSAYTTLGF